MGKGRAMVILSGGFDSVALLHWARAEFEEVRAVSFDYGQPHLDAELSAAQLIAEGMGLNAPNGRWERVKLTGLGPFDVTPGYAKPKVARAFVPLRNLVFAAYAGNRAALTWPGSSATILYGANVDDAAGFADCRRGFIAQASEAIHQAVDGFTELTLRAPWVEMSWRKEDILRWAVDHGALEDVRRSMSCYRGTRCRACDSCTRRQKAFELLGLVDNVEQGGPKMRGGDPAREHRRLDLAK